jgi:hypothetical protein
VSPSWLRLIAFRFTVGLTFRNRLENKFGLLLCALPCRQFSRRVFQQLITKAKGNFHVLQTNTCQLIWSEMLFVTGEWKCVTLSVFPEWMFCTRSTDTLSWTWYRPSNHWFSKSWALRKYVWYKLSGLRVLGLRNCTKYVTRVHKPLVTSTYRTVSSSYAEDEERSICSDA